MRSVRPRNLPIITLLLLCGNTFYLSLNISLAVFLPREPGTIPEPLSPPPPLPDCEDVVSRADITYDFYSNNWPKNEEDSRLVSEQITGVIFEARKHAGLALVMHEFFEHVGPSALLTVWHSNQNKEYIESIIHNKLDFTSNKTQLEILKNWSATNSSLLQDQFRAGKLKLYNLEGGNTSSGRMARRNSHLGNIGIGTDSYNKFFTSPQFWDSFNTSYVLTLQGDTLLCRPISSRNFDLSYIGGLSEFRFDWGDEKKFHSRRWEPIYQFFTLPADPTHRAVVDSHMNGGLSLRNVQWARECVEQFGRSHDWIEDTLFTFCYDKLKSSNFTPESFAYEFSSDNGHTMCHNTPGENGSQTSTRVCPSGVHKPWVKKREKCREYQELTRYCPSITALEHLQFVFQ